MDQWQKDGVEILCAVAEDDTWACPEYLELVARQNGKGVIDEARVMAGFLLWLERLILWSAQLRDTALEGFLRVEDLLRNLGRGVGKNMILIGPVPCPPKCKPGACRFDEGNGHIIPIKVNYTNGKEAFIRLDTRQRIKVITRSEQSGRGLSPDTIVVDEAMFFTDGEQEALAFAQSARPNPQMIYTSSPPLDGDSGEVLFRLRDRAEAMLRGEPVDAEDEDDEPEALGARIWGVEGDLDHLGKIDLRDPSVITAANPAYGIRIMPRTVQRERRKMTPRGFARERACIWPVPRLVAGGRIDPDRWESLQDPTSTWVRSIGCSFGVEVAPELDAAAIVLYGVREDELGHVELVDRRVGIKWLMPRLKELKQEKDPIAIGMTAMTYGVLKADLKEAGMVRPEDRKHADDDDDPERTRPRRGDLLVTGGPDAAAACGQIIVAVDERGIRVKPHPAYPEILDAAALGAKTQRSGDALKWVRSDKAEEIEISPVGAMSSARFTHLSRVGVLVEEKPPPAAPLMDDDGARGSESDGGGLMGVGF